MKKYLMHFNEYEPKYMQIFKKVKRLIDKGEILNDEKLPTIREMSKILHVNNVTIVNAYKKLESEGYAKMKMGSGTYAKKKEVMVHFKRDYSATFKNMNNENMKTIIDFAGETASGLYFPIKEFKNAINEVIDRDGADSFMYQERLGYEGLRNVIKDKFWNGKADLNNILILSGAQQGIDIVSKAMININDDVAIEKPSYGGAISVFNGRRANIYDIPIMEDGIDVDMFEKILKKNNIKIFYTMSYFQNPTGASYSFEKKQRILELAQIYDFYIVEDDYLSELIYDNSISYNSFKSMDVNDRVIYIKSFSKIFLPGIRLGYMITPKSFRETIQNCKINTDIATSSLMQRALSLYIEKGFWKGHIDMLNAEYGRRYRFMEKCIDEKLEHSVDFIPSGGGLNFFLKFKDDVNISSTELFYEARKKSVIITPGVMFYKNFDDGLRSMRIGFAQTDEVKIEKGLDILASIMEE